jgi:hypothetical protein
MASDVRPTGNSTQFRARGVQAEVLATPVYVTCALLGIYGLATGVAEVAPLPAVVGLVALVFAALMLYDVAYSIWGTLELERNDTGWSARKQLSRIVRTREIHAAAIMGAELYKPGPGGRGPQVHVYLRGRRSPISIGEGLGLDEEVLVALRDMFIAAMWQPQPAAAAHTTRSRR